MFVKLFEVKLFELGKNSKRNYGYLKNDRRLFVAGKLSDIWII